MTLSKERQKRISKKMSYVLRHRPDIFELKMDNQGWVLVSELLLGFESSRSSVLQEELDEVVELNPKQRFEYSEDRLQIRARQGHSIKGLDLGYTPQSPPEVLYHGTPSRNREVIETSGLNRMNRHHVHLSPDTKTANVVGTRGSKTCIVYVIDTAGMLADGHVFYKTENDVWLVDSVPPEFLSVLGPAT